MEWTPLLVQERIMSQSRFRHYKGDIYTFLHVAQHSETEAWFVVYQSPKGSVWIRPFEMFFETVQVEGKSVPRFEIMNG